MKLKSSILAWVHILKIIVPQNMKLLNVPFLVLTLSTVLGVIIGWYDLLSYPISLTLFIVLVAILSLTWYHSKKIDSRSHSFTIFTILTFIAFGVVLVQIHHPKNDDNHYSHKIKEEQYSKSALGLKFHIKERLKSTAYYHKYIVAIKHIGENSAKGNLLLQIPKKKTLHLLHIGDTYTVYAKLKVIPGAIHPYQFDYAKYLRNFYVHHRIIVPYDQLVRNVEIHQSPFRLADRLRKQINADLSKFSFTPQQLSIINALLLGQRQDIDDKTFERYRDAGALHILAISGLHVGIILYILNILVKPLQRWRRHGKRCSLLIILICLWCFAIVAGLSPSVLRAVTMFSFLAIGVQFRSQIAMYNALFISMFLLLCFDPLLLFSVGFQLSYLAVFSIVWIQPLLSKIYHPRYYISKVVWETCTVTVAAQLCLFPLSLFYFHQFPLLFLVSNLIIIPFLGILLGFGILVIILAMLHILPEVVAKVLGTCIDSINVLITWISNQDKFILEDIPFSWRMLVVTYTIIIALVFLFQKYERRRLYGLMVPTLFLFLIFTYEKQYAHTLQELIIFQNKENTTIGILENRKLKLYSKQAITRSEKSFLAGSYSITNKVHIDSSFFPLKNMYRYKDHTIAIIDSSSAIHYFQHSKPDIILLTGSPKIHLDRLIDSLQPKQIIADGHNYKYLMVKWESTCNRQGVPFHNVNKAGAFILR
ncbi:ComEC family competence protein [Aquimarina sp. U1-2]|uniref:ComEC/Rec2 family competence protein n=1 Tax=Aquimarina sp. U1-2 TaxID=2823141 RepID=UPI001AEC8678|nr:ComEC/Rec2 family competence protein [Aquimarina sp. U1-2]MBP2832588.1 ComEC family competence protein [Aquimarina sp. U1-2]